MSREPQQRGRMLDPAGTLEALSRTFLDSALDCIITMDATGRVQEFNPACGARYSVLRRSEAVGKELAELIIPPRLRERHRQGLARYLKTGEGPLIGKLIEIEALRRDGSGDYGGACDQRNRGQWIADFHGLFARHHRAQTRRRN